MEFLHVNHCRTTEDDFGFVTKGHVESTAEGRQFINGKSHHPKARFNRFKSILFGEAIRLKRLNQRKEDYSPAKSDLKEKAIRSNFPWNMTNDAITMASNLKEREKDRKRTDHN